MNVTVPIAMFGWPLVVLMFFLYLRPLRAVIFSMLGAWMFLPMASYSVPGMPDVTKMSITCVSILAAMVIFDPKRATYFSWSWWDLLMIGWIIAPIPSCSLSQFGLYEGVSGVLKHLISWGAPYLIGRLYFSDSRSLLELAIAFFVSGLLYLPFVLFEVRMSPQLHAWIYGYYQHSFSQTFRFGGWRPTVFMEHGLAVSSFMATASICGTYLWYRHALKSMLSIPIWALVLAVLGGTLLCKSTYAVILTVFSIGILIFSERIRTRVLILSLALFPLFYISARTVGNWNAQILLDLASFFGSERLESLQTRLDSEDALWDWVKGSTIFGWARLESILESSDVYGRFIPDGFWLIALGAFGLFGLVSVFGVLLAPCISYLYRFKSRQIFSRDMAGATCLCVVLVAYALDNLLNAMLNPMFLLAAGGLLGMSPKRESIHGGLTL